MATFYKALIVFFISLPLVWANEETAVYEDLLHYRSGFGQNVTGGAGGEVVVIKTLDFHELKKALIDDKPKWIRFKAGLSGAIEIEETLFIGSNKTIDGRGADITLTSPDDCDGILFWGTKKQGKPTSIRRNLIIHNIKITRVGSGRNCGQGIGIAFNAQDIWVDHVSFSQNGDESLSMGKGATNLTASWCKFIDTDKAILLGWSDGDDPEKERALDEKMKVTVHHSFFDNVNGRTPILTYGKAHFYNNFQRDWNWAAAASYEWGELYSENNIYVGSKKNSSAPAIDTTHLPRWFLADGYATTKGDVFLDTDPSKHTRGSGINTGKVFSPRKYYHYKAEAPNHHLQQRLMKYAGWSKDPQWPAFKPAKIFVDTDNDGIMDIDDNCPSISNKNQLDIDLDGEGNRCDLNDDNDRILDAQDNCLLIMNNDQTDSDEDGLGNACDTDDDNDRVLDTLDNCPLQSNADQLNIDKDGKGNVCDNTPAIENGKDSDEDGIPDATDNCPVQPNPNQLDINSNGKGNACDNDDDSDNVVDYADNCPVTFNLNQLDTDADGEGNGCDKDDDNDSIKDAADNCPLIHNVAQKDKDNDKIGDACDDDDDNDTISNDTDNCPNISNKAQTNSDNDPHGNACDNDDDNDNIVDDKDNCPLNININQQDTDKDGKGDVCDPSPQGGKDPVIIDRIIATGNDDAEESNNTGRIITWGDLLDMVKQSSGDQLLGLRYTHITIPANATIKSAWLQFTAKKPSSDPTKLIIKGEQHLNSVTFNDSPHNISNRSTTNATVIWSPAVWAKKNDSGTAQRSADIARIIQEIINQKGWKAGNALSLIISGSGYRGAYTRNSAAKKAAKLHIEYIVN